MDQYNALWNAKTYVRPDTSGSRRYRSNSRSDACLSLNIFWSRTPFILQRLVQGCCIYVLRPPLTPASQEDLIGVGWEVISGESTKKALSTCFLLLAIPDCLIFRAA
jgi:hypothetical protein